MKQILITIFAIFFCVQLFAQEKKIETIKITDSIYVFKPYIDWVHGNGVAIIGNDGVFFIDTYIQTNYAEESIKKLKEITDLPVKYVLNTHWHNDHVMGNYAFKKAFPDCKFIGHDSTYIYMNRIIKTAIDNELQTFQGDVDQLTKELEERKTSGGFELTGNMIQFWQDMIVDEKEYVDTYKPNQFVNHDITFNDKMTFHWGSQTIELIYDNSNGHSPGDVVVWIPEKKIVLTGDIIVGPTPYATYYNIPGMIKAIQKIIDMNPAIIIPGHGVVLYDLSYPNLLKEAFTEYYNEAEKAIKNNTPVRDAMSSIKLNDIDMKFTGGDSLKEWAYRSFFARNVIYNTYRYNRALPKKQ